MALNYKMTTMKGAWFDFKSQSPEQKSFAVGITLGLVFFAYAIVHCQFYVSYVIQEKTALYDSFIWAIAKFGAWLIICPNLFRFCSRHKNKPARGAVAFLTALGVAVTSSTYISGVFGLFSTPQASLVYFFPGQVSTSLFVVFVWYLFVRPGNGDDATQPETEEKDCKHSITPGANGSITLNVSSGASECVVDSCDIEFCAAAGNYVEIHTVGQVYILRSTMKQLEEQLQPYGFVRVHRSYLINLQALKGRGQNQTLLLSSGRSVPCSRRYRSTF